MQRDLRDVPGALLQVSTFIIPHDLLYLFSNLLFANLTCYRFKDYTDIIRIYFYTYSNGAFT
jgi:hypothetical protein